MAYRRADTSYSFEYMDALGPIGSGCAYRRGGVDGCREDADAQAWCSGVDTFIRDYPDWIVLQRRRRRHRLASSATTTAAASARGRQHLRGRNGLHASEQLRPQRAQHNQGRANHLREQFGCRARRRIRRAYRPGCDRHRDHQFRIVHGSNIQHVRHLELPLHPSRGDGRKAHSSLAVDRFC